MEPQVRVHVATAAVLGSIVSVVTLFYVFPKLFLFIVLLIVAALSYGALYLILAARMDPRRDGATSNAPVVRDAEPVAAPSTSALGAGKSRTGTAGKARKKTAKRTRKKASTKATKKTSKRKKTSARKNKR